MVSEDELERRIGNLVLRHRELNSELASYQAIAEEYVNFYLRLNGKLQEIYPNEQIDMSQYPSEDEVQELIDDLYNKRKELEAVKTVARLYGFELK